MNMQRIAADIARELRANPTLWTRFEAREREGVPACIMGHIRRRAGSYVTGRNGELAGFVKALSPSWQRKCGYEDGALGIGASTCLMLWNDYPHRSVKDVIALCDRVAAGVTVRKEKDVFQRLVELLRPIGFLRGSKHESL